MNLVYRLMAVLLISGGLAAALSIVPKLDSTVRLSGTNEVMFRTDSAVSLTDRNVVDLFVRYPLYLDISRVEWNDAILSVDLKAKPNETAAASIYDDLFELAKLGFAGTSNVSQLLVRVMEHSSAGGSLQLLLAMDAKRSDLIGGSFSSDMIKNKTKEQFLSSHFSLTYTHKWLDQHRR